MIDYLQMWSRDLLTQKSGTVRLEAEAWGECKRHTGPSIWYARVKLSIAPSDHLEVVDQLDHDKSVRLKSEGWYDQIIFGVLDVMMNDLPSPYGEFKLVIIDAEIDEIGARSSAFRLAARDATIKMLPRLW